ncbi:MAG: ATP-binding protein, partial [Candidatus Limnocylindrales bacterium]
EVTGHDVEADGRPARLILAVDVTERRRLEEQLRQAQKMEAVGRLAGGVAHDFNNLLTAINGYAELIRSQLDDDDPLAADVDEIRRSGDRAAGLTRQLLAFGRRQVLAAQVFDLDELVANLEAMLRRLISEDVEFATILGAGQVQIRADPGQIEQVILNLVVNARDAMPAGGRLTVETQRLELDGPYAVDHLGVEPGPYVLLSVSDTGAGMTPEVLAQAFEPFFTTKPAGQGTGLGLSTVYGIVTQTGGQVWGYSEPGRGSTFKVYLPAAGSEERPPEPAHSTTPGAAGGSETILLVEDEPAVLSLMATVLRRQGYRVLTASDAAAAFQLAELEPGGIDLLITDVVMPGEPGSGLAARMHARWPDIPVIFMSGYAEQAVVRHGVLDGAAAFLSKPFDPALLTRRVREVLDSRGPS